MRSDDDQWSITESVGITALGVASGRAMETHRDDGLVRDPYAEAFVAAADAEVTLPTRPTDDPGWATPSTYIGVRSRFFDRFFGDATAEGVRQVVLLAAGLDTRAQRLAWPAGTTVYEVDQPAVLAFKDRVLAGIPTTTDPEPLEADRDAHRVTVPVDLRHDWPAALRDAGFDPTAPTAWLAEGLLPYLPAQAEVDLFTRVEELSAPGSHLAVEHFGESVPRHADDEILVTMSQRVGLDIRELFYDEPREDPGERLRRDGWEVTSVKAADLAIRYGRPLDDAHAAVFGGIVLLAARLGQDA